MTAARKYQKVKIHYGDRHEVKAWVPPEHMTRIAQERTDGISNYFLEAAHRSGLSYIDDVKTLARSCYLQGINDMLDSIRENGKKS